MTEFSDLKTKIEKTLTDESVPLWFPDLTKDLVNFGWKKLNKERQIGLESYSTNHLLLPNSNAPYEVIAKFPKDTKSITANDVIQLEILSPEITGFYKDQGAEFYESSEILNSPIVETLLEAFSVIKQVPSLNESVFNLVRMLHLIKSDVAGEYDISFSEPHIPFSIFVSVPSRRVFADFLRVAEAIIHEAMHLQLTLIERVVSLFVESNNLYFSPWKAEYRKANGILHALYVFQIIDSVYRQITHCLQSKKYEDYIVNRQNLISRQVEKVSKIDLSVDLTENGKIFISKLITNLI